MWEGFRAIIGYKGITSSPPNISANLKEELNHFYARLDLQNKDQVMHPLPSNNAAPMLSCHEVRLCLWNIKPRKADGVAGPVLKDCTGQLSKVFTDIFNLFLSSSQVPACFKTSTIIPVPKQSAVTFLNDYRPMAFTPFPAKCLERLVMKHIPSAITASSDQYQLHTHTGRTVCLRMK